MSKLNTTSVLIVMVLSFTTLFVTGILTSRSETITSDLSIALLLVLSLVFVRAYKNRFKHMHK